MLWDYILQKGDASGEIPTMRWQQYHIRHPKNVEILARTTSKGYFLDLIEDFASFFGVSPREAEQMDPQQRITLEMAWQALEDAEIAPDPLSGAGTAVFMGMAIESRRVERKRGVCRREDSLIAQKALSDAKAPTDTISYVEAHATSTALGDPTEMGALASVYGGSDRRVAHPSCYVRLCEVEYWTPRGSSRTKIDWQQNGFRISKDNVQLYRHSLSPVRAAVASYGHSGMVSHAIIEAKASPGLSPQHGGERESRDTPVVLCLSAPQ
ncbi:beta-ketoacyl synthase domain-containing protein [Seiridium cupressi]